MHEQSDTCSIVRLKAMKCYMEVELVNLYTTSKMLNITIDVTDSNGE